MKKLFLLLIILLFSTSANATTYYVSNDGNDLADGTSESTPWKTVQKVHNFSFSPDDTVKFKGNDVWRVVEELSTSKLYIDAGTPGHPVTVSSYGTGKPYLIGSISKSDTGDWTNYSGNLWRTSIAINYIPFQVVYNFWTDPVKATWGTHNWVNLTYETQNNAPTTQGTWNYDYSTHYLTIYSVGNPASVYSSIEIPVKNTNWTSTDDIISPRDYVTIDGLFIGLSSRHGVSIGNNDGVTVKNCEIAWCGKHFWTNHTTEGWYLNGIGNGVEFWQSSGETVSDGIVEKNKIWQCFDAALTNQGNTGKGDNLIFRNNVVFNCEYGFESWSGSNDYINTNVQLVNNTFAYNGYGWGHERSISPGLTDYKGFDISFFYRNSNYVIKNNIYYKAKTCPITIDFDRYYTFDGDYNLYYAPDVPFIFRDGMYGTTGYSPAQFATYQSETGHDTHGMYSDPLFIDATNYDFRLSGSSPAIDAGTDLGIDEDFTGNTRDASPDIGAYEYTDVVVVDDPSSIISTSHFTETDIVGGVTIYADLTNVTWAADLASDSASNLAFRQSFDGDIAGCATCWDTLITTGSSYTWVTRTSDTRATYTIPAIPTFNIPYSENVSVDFAAACTSVSVVVSANDIIITAITTPAAALGTIYSSDAGTTLYLESAKTTLYGE